MTKSRRMRDEMKNNENKNYNTLKMPICVDNNGR